MKFFNITFIALGILYVLQPAMALANGCDYWCGKKGMAAGQALWQGGNGGYSSAADPAIVAAKNATYNQCMAETAHMTREQCDGKAAEVADVPTPSANPSRCATEYQDLVGKCDSQLASARNSCDDTKNSEINAAKSNAQSAGSSSSSGITDSCSGAGSVNTSAKNAWTSYKNSCDSAIGACQNSCSELVNWANSNQSCFPLQAGGQTITKDYLSSQIYSPKASACMDLQSKVDSANTMISSYGGTASDSDACKTDTAGGESSAKKDGSLASTIGQLGAMAAGMLGQSGQSQTATSSQVATFCQANPSYPGCGNGAAANCNDPNYASTNRVCQCAANPGLCRVQESSSASLAPSLADPGSRLSSENASIGGGDIPMTPVDPITGRPSSNDVQGIDGRQGGGAPVGSAGGGSGGNGFKNAKVNDVPGDALGGLGGGGTFGGGGGGGRAHGGSGAGGGAYGRPGERGTASANNPNGPDLRQFLPGGTYNPRPNTVGGKVGIDGITGPNSNNWQKVQNRYQVLKESLYP